MQSRPDLSRQIVLGIEVERSVSTRPVLPSKGIHEENKALVPIPIPKPGEPFPQIPVKPFTVGPVPPIPPQVLRTKPIPAKAGAIKSQGHAKASASKVPHDPLVESDHDVDIPTDIVDLDIHGVDIPLEKARPIVGRESVLR